MGIPRFVVGMILVLLIVRQASAQLVEPAGPSLAKPGCQEKCGKVTIPFPFGIGANCSGHVNFKIICNNSFTPPRSFLSNTSIELEIIEISLEEGTIRVSDPGIQAHNGLSLRGPFTFSDNQSRFTAVLDWRTYWKYHNSTNGSFTKCGRNTVCSKHGFCSCSEGYEGNPYVPHGCQDIDECDSYYRVREECQQICHNTPGSYKCSCVRGFELIGRYACNPIHDNKTRMAVIGSCSGLGGLFFLIVLWWLYKLFQRRKIKKQKEKFFKKNGGLLLQKQVSSGESNVEKMKIFTSKELEKATDYYNKDRILGQGGQGTVYKGMLTDGRIVAVKKSKIEEERYLDHFINEVVILSQINHRNIVKLHGCCLEMELPLLVYEFIPNGTLFQYIHDQNEEFPLTWDVRVRVATEIAGALFYLHSAASIPIYHRDIKSSNILLDDKYRAKVADFGTSRSINFDQSHLTTRVQGTFGYFDPEYFQSSQFTDKSDVYSFGVVLVELLTGQKPILSARSDDEGRSLATLFLLAMEENRLFDILDSWVIKEGGKEKIMAFANLAYKCLNMNGRNRPTMKQVAMELEGITTSHAASTGHEHYEEVEHSGAEQMGPWDTTSTSINSSGNSSVSDYQ